MVSRPVNLETGKSYRVVAFLLKGCQCPADYFDN